MDFSALTSIAVEGTGLAEYLFVLYNFLSGQLLPSQQTTEQKARIDVNMLPGGAYFVKMIGEKGV